MMKTVLLAVMLVLSLSHQTAADHQYWPTVSHDFGPAPKTFVSLDALKRWIYVHRRYGMPQSADFDLIGLRLYVTWNGPLSGPASNFSWAYYRSAKDLKWHQIETSFHPTAILGYAYVDTRATTLVYISTDGKRIKTLNLKPLQFK